MRRRFMLVGTVALIVAGLTFAVSSPVGAARAGQHVCPAFTSLGINEYTATVGTGFTCASAKTWIVKLISERVKGAGEVTLTNGPKGLRCFATFEAKGHAAGGWCYKGPQASPSSGFTWGIGG